MHKDDTHKSRRGWPAAYLHIGQRAMRASKARLARTLARGLVAGAKLCLGPMGVIRACQQREGWLATPRGDHIQDHTMVRNLRQMRRLAIGLAITDDGSSQVARHLPSFFDRRASLPGPACWPEASQVSCHGHGFSLIRGVGLFRVPTPSPKLLRPGSTGGDDGFQEVGF